MHLAVDVTLPNVLNLISQMSLDEIEEIKDSIIKKELYFKKFKKDDIDDIVSDFKKEDYSSKFLEDLEEGLRKSSVYED